MNIKIPIHLFQGILHLDVINLEEKLSENTASYLFENEYFIDLSQCRFVELSALAKLLLVIESFCKTNKTIFLALPTCRHTIKEEQKKPNIEYSPELKHNLLRARKKANNFLKITGFVSAIQQIAKLYEKEIYISEDYDFISKKFNIDSFSNSFSVIYDSFSIEEYNYKYIFPFRWIDCSQGLYDFANIETDLRKILENVERGIDSMDVIAIKNVILSELVKNVNEHSGSKYALLAIGLIDSKSLVMERDNKKRNIIEEEYLLWINTNRFSSQVEIYFGDSGNGILTKDYREKYNKNKKGILFTQEDQLELSFQKWTTLKNDEPRRGTKGLYRILRIINKYNGLVHIDTGFINGGFIKGGKSNAQWKSRNSKYFFNGTLINIKLNPIREIRAFNYVLQTDKKEKKWNSARFLVNRDLNCLELIKSKIRESDNLLIILSLDNLEDEIAKETLEILLPEISYDSHPCAVVIYLISDLENDTVDIITDSVNTHIIEKSKNEVFPEILNEEIEEIYDPVLVIGDKNRAFWFGGNQELISILNKSFQSTTEGETHLEKIDTYSSIISEEKRADIKLYLQNVNKLVNLDQENNLVFNFNSIDHHYEQVLTNRLNVKTAKSYCTPKLEITNNWINITELLEEDEYGFALCLYLKYRHTINISKLNKKNTFILIDHIQHKELAKAFCNLIGINRKNIRNIYSDIDTNIPKRTKLFPKHSNVIVLTTIISSSETIRRLVKYIKRDFANPDKILCLVNLRKYNINKLETWNEITDIISCFQKNKNEVEKSERNIEYFSQKSNSLDNNLILINPNFKIENNATIIEIDTELKKFIVDHKLLHYNHIGVYNKRHFTFFIDKAKLFDIESFIWNKIKISIDQWKSNINITQFSIYLPKSILNNGGSFYKFLKGISGKSPVAYEETPKIINDLNVIYFDFGMLTGESVNKFITSCKGVENLFVCILFNQSVNVKTDFYRRIETLNNEYNFLEGKNNSTKFNIDYLYHLPLSFFSSENCPICEHRRALDFYKLEQEYLFSFSEDRQERLEQLQADEIQEINYPVDFYYTEKDIKYELSSSLIMKMYEYKILFENARISTKFRINLYKEIYELSYNDLLIKDCESKLYAFLYYLSFEINWFQQEPLIFRDFRELISNIALKIALIDRSTLQIYFDNSNYSKTSAEKLVVRYKYSAISVLRSTQKLKFCENINEIIKSSLLNDKYSDNLLQNTLYHISSLLHNKYNRSESYFNMIKSNLENILSTTKFLTLEQKIAINFVLLRNAKTLRSLKDSLADNESKNFINMKSEWEKLYLETPNHPIPFIHFDAINLKKHLDTLNSYKEETISTDSSEILLDIINDLESNWGSVNGYLHNHIYYYLEEELNLLMNSSFFLYNYSNYLNFTRFQENSERFTRLIYIVQSDPINYLNLQDEYDKLYKYFETCFIRKKGLQDFNEDSFILNLLSEFPSCLIDLINDGFSTSKFKKFQVTNHLNSDKVYFPEIVFKRNLKLIKDNLNKRLNDGIAISDVNIRINLFDDETQLDFLILTIAYDSTNNYNQEQKKHGGSLDLLNKELIEFGGGLSYELPTDKNPDFTLHLKFKKYEGI
jgi:hypothetical protein